MVELSWGLAGVSTGVASFDGDLLIGIFWTGFALTGHLLSLFLFPCLGRRAPRRRAFAMCVCMNVCVLTLFSRGMGEFSYCCSSAQNTHEKWL